MKYELTEETKQHEGRTLYRIRALKDFGAVKKGALGGWVESEENLSHYGDSWVSGHATVSGHAAVCGHAYIFGHATVCGHANVFGLANISGDAYISGDATVSGHANVSGSANISGDATVSGHANISGDAYIFGHAYIFGSVYIFGDANIYYQTLKASRSDGYDFIICKDKESILRIIAGCRYFSIEEACAHWDAKHPKHDETALILDYLVAQAKRLGWEVET